MRKSRPASISVKTMSTTGDGLLAEFSSVHDAVAAAESIQAVIAAGNSSGDPARRLEFRIGVHVGDVIDEGEDVLGDGVNIAAHLQEPAPPGASAFPRRYTNRSAKGSMCASLTWGIASSRTSPSRYACSALCLSPTAGDAGPRSPRECDGWRGLRPSSCSPLRLRPVGGRRNSLASTPNFDPGRLPSPPPSWCCPFPISAATQRRIIWAMELRKTFALLDIDGVLWRVPLPRSIG